MGSLILPTSGPVYADAQIFLDSVEKHPTYAPALRPVWEAVAQGVFEVVTSELTLLETLVGPMKQGDPSLEADYENLDLNPGIRLLPITLPILRVGARHRARLSRVRTPDALHAATAGYCACTLFLTNDAVFRHIPGLPVVILDDVLSP
ncbi:MAG: type II toxin-antitoxin system VapC family toxin [Isosphaeraceae bacterium]